MFDTHCHIHDAAMFTGVARSRHQPGPPTPEQYLAAARETGVEELLCVGTTPEDNRQALAFALAHPGVYAAVGFHPGYVKGSGRPKPAKNELLPPLNHLCQNPAVVAIGEIGLDFADPAAEKATQIALLEQLLQLATEVKKPVILHIRQAFAEAFAVIDHFPGLQGVLHSFTGDQAALEQALSRGLLIGINGIATFTKEVEQQAAYAAIPLDRLLLETDAPFLTPVPFRGRINQPAYLKAVAEWVGTTRGLSLTEVAQITTQNAHQLFQISR